MSKYLFNLLFIVLTNKIVANRNAIFASFFNLFIASIRFYVSIDGHIKVFTDNKAEPIIEAYDPFVLPVQYLSFASYQGSQNEYLYNCKSDKTTVDTSNDIKKQPVEGPTNDLSRISLDSKQ